MDRGANEFRVTTVWDKNEGHPTRQIALNKCFWNRYVTKVLKISRVIDKHYCNHNNLWIDVALHLLAHLFYEFGHGLAVEIELWPLLYPISECMLFGQTALVDQMDYLHCRFTQEVCHLQHVFALEHKLCVQGYLLLHVVELSLNRPHLH